MDGKNLVTKTKIRLRSRITRTSDDLDRFMSRLLLCHTPAQPRRQDARPRAAAVRPAVLRGVRGLAAPVTFPAIPPISDAQAEALEALHFLGERFGVSTSLGKGRHEVRQQRRSVLRTGWRYRFTGEAVGISHCSCIL